MNARFAALLLLALVCGPACAQTLRRDHSVYDLAATRDLLLGQTTIIGSYTNNGVIPVHPHKVVFALYDADGQEVGRLAQHTDEDLAPGETWHIRATTPLTFVRYAPVTDAPPEFTPASYSRSPVAQRAPARKKAVVRAKPAATPAATPAKTYVYRKPELYNWSQHRGPANRAVRRKPTSTAPAGRPAAAPAAMPPKSVTTSTAPLPSPPSPERR